MRLSRIITASNRAEIVRAVKDAPSGSQIELIDDPRSLAQNRLMWALLADFAEQVPIGGEYYDREDWKAAFMKALGVKLRFMPSLDGQGVVAVGYRSSKLGKEKMSDLIELIYSEGARLGVRFHGEAA